jgi:DNA-binding response OmpR family regulator
MDVLIVERDKLLAEVIADALADDGITVTVVPDEQRALAIPVE